MAARNDDALVGPPPGAPGAAPQGESPTLRQFISSAVALVAGATVYELALVHLARQSLLFEVVLSVFFPLVVLWGGWIRAWAPRIPELIAIESIFTVTAVCAKAAFVWWPEAIKFIDIVFVLFFAVQVAGFIMQYAKQSRLGTLQAALMGLFLFDWWWHRPPTGTVVDDAGRLLVFGADAPLALRLAYVVWFVNVVLSLTKSLPRMHQALIHGVSVTIAFASGEFFHVRLLTACHLFVLDSIFCFVGPRPGRPEDGFATLPPQWLRLHERFGRRFISWLTTGLLFGLLILHVSGRLP